MHSESKVRPLLKLRCPEICYQTGIRISDEQMAALNITPNQHIPKWNYTISPSVH